MLAPLFSPRSTMSRSHAESHRRIKLISAEIDRLLTRLRSLGEGDPARVLSELVATAATARHQPELLEWAAFLDAHAHLIARGGALALLQGAVGLASASLVTLAAEEWALGRSWKVNWLRRTQRPRDWSPGSLLRAFDLEGYRGGAWVVLGGKQLLGPTGPTGGLRVQGLLDSLVTSEAAPERRGVEAILPVAGGALLVAGDDGSLQVWGSEPLAQQSRQGGHTGAVTALHASADGQQALTLGADGAMIFWSVSPLKKLHTMAPEGRPPRVVTLSPGGSYAIAGYSDGRVELHPTGDKGRHKVLRGHQAPVERLLALKGVLISSDNRGEIRLWSMPSGEPLRELRGHQRPVGFLWAHEGRLLSSSSDGQVRLWAIETGEPLLSLAGVGDGLQAACALSDGRVGLGAVDGSVRLLDTATGATTPVGSHEGPVVSLWPVDDNALLSCGLDRVARLWLLGGAAPNLAQRAVQGLDADGLRALCVTTTGETEMFDFAEGRRLRKITTEPGTRVQSLLEHGRLLIDTAAPPLPLFGSAPADQRLHTLRVVEADQGQPLLTLTGHRLAVRAALVDDKARWLATGSADGEVKLWDFTTGAPLLALRGHDAPVLALAFEPDGIELYALYQGNEVCTWSTRSGKLLRRVPLQHAPEHPLSLLGAAGERELVMAGHGGEIGRWDAESGRRTKGWRAHPGEVRALSLDPDGELLATGGDDRRVRLWKRSTGKLLTQYDFTAPVAGCRFLPDGRLAAWSDLGEPHYLKFVDWAQDD